MAKKPTKAASIRKGAVSKQEEPTNSVATAAGDKGKSIVDPKYRERYVTPDWLGEIVVKQCCPLVEKKKVVVDGEDRKTQTVKEPGDVDVSLLFELAEENNLDIGKYREMDSASRGFSGRMRMTIRNMLQAATKRRHGLFVNGKWVKADESWLESKRAPVEPTHKRDGEKIANKPAKAAKEAA